MNIAICLDMYLCFKNPFYPAGRRLKFYYIGLGLLVLLFTSMEKWIPDPLEYKYSYEIIQILDGIDDMKVGTDKLDAAIMEILGYDKNDKTD